MAKEHSYTQTLKNNRTENEAIRYLLKSDKRLRLPNSVERKAILIALGLDKKYSRAFDLVRVPVGKEIESSKPNKWVLVELKTTKKKLPDNPKGFFFGATENEFDLARKMGGRFEFCFVSLHPESLSGKYLSLPNLEKLIKTKRTQYQINL